MSVTGILSFSIFCYQWYKYIPKNENTPSYYNPLIIIVFLVSIGFGIFNVSNFVVQTYNISRGLTFKQTLSINEKIDEIRKKGSKQQISYCYRRNYTFKEKLINIIKFLFTKVDKSLIIPERDLFTNKI